MRIERSKKPPAENATGPKLTRIEAWTAVVGCLAAVAGVVIAAVELFQ